MQFSNSWINMTAVAFVLCTALTSLRGGSAPSEASENCMLGRVGAWDVRACGGLPMLYRRGRLVWSWLDSGVKLFLRRKAGGAASALTFFCSVTKRSENRLINTFHWVISGRVTGKTTAETNSSKYRGHCSTRHNISIKVPRKYGYVVTPTPSRFQHSSTQTPQ